jgi:hypothetical protein
MPKVTHNQEKIQKQKKIISTIAAILLIIIMIIAFIFPNTVRFYIWIPISLTIFGIANLLMRRVGKTAL